MKKIITFSILSLISFSAFSQTRIRVKEKPFKGKELYNYVSTINVADSNSKGYKTYIENHKPWGENTGMSIYINLERLKEYDSILNLAILKFAEWKKTCDSLGINEFKKEMPFTFKTDGSMIKDYGYSSGGSVDIKFTFRRRESFHSPVPTNTLEIQAYASSYARSGIYLIELTDVPVPQSYWEILDENGKTVKVFTKPKRSQIRFENKADDFDLNRFYESPNFNEQVQLYRDLLDYDYIISQMKSHYSQQSSFK
jgi:hypothetical protein